MHSRRMLLSALLCGCVIPVIQGGSSSAGGAIQIVSVQHIPLVRVRAILRNGTDGSIVVPYCGDVAGTKKLCGLGTHLEVHTQAGWKPARLRPSSGVLGGLPLDQVQTLQSGGESSFVYEFATDIFLINEQDQLRFVIDTWPDRESMLGGKTGSQIPTDPFQLPLPPRKQ